MSEFTKEIQIPMSERVKLADLQFDGCNPNRLSREGMERLKASIKKWGDIVPIVTNKDILVADGAQRTLSKPEQAFQIQSDIEWIYAVTIDDTPESSSLAIYRTSNLHTNVDFCFKAWSSILRYFPSSHEIPRELHQLEQSANLTLHAIGAYEEATNREKPEMPQLQPR